MRKTEMITYCSKLKPNRHGTWLIRANTERKEWRVPDESSPSSSSASLFCLSYPSRYKRLGRSWKTFVRYSSMLVTSQLNKSRIWSSFSSFCKKTTTSMLSIAGQTRIRPHVYPSQFAPVHAWHDTSPFIWLRFDAIDWCRKLSHECQQIAHP